MKKIQATNSFINKWRANGLTIAFLLILFCFLIGNDHYNAYALTRKNRAILSDREIVNYQNIPIPEPSWLVSKFLAGGDNCASATDITSYPFTDTGNTTGANNTITNYNRPSLAFPYGGPDHYYRLVLNGTSINVNASMSLTGSTLDGALFLTNVCPAGTGNTIPAANALGNSQDAIGPGAGPELMTVTNLPAGTYYIGIDSYYSSGSASAGPYSITITAAPTVAASVPVGGRIVNAQGTGISGVRVALVKPSGEVLSAITSPFGYYQFEGLEVGFTYTINVSHKRYQFANPTQVITPKDSLQNIDFVAEP